METIAVKAQLIKDIRGALVGEGKTRVKTVGRFRSQIENHNKEIQYKKPAAFIEFIQNVWKNQQQGTQTSDSIIRVHLLIDDFARDEDDFFLIIQEVHAALQQLQLSCGSTLDRIDELDDTDHDRIADWGIDYAYRIDDPTGDRRLKLESGIIGIELTKCVGDTAITLPLIQAKMKIIDISFGNGGDNDRLLTITASSAGTFVNETLINVDTVKYEIDNGGGFQEVQIGVDFITQVGKLLKTTITRTDPNAEASVVVQTS